MIPLKSIKSIGVGSFTAAAKPLGLARLEVHYHRDDDWDETIYLVPATSGFAPCWDTSKLVLDWFATLGHVEALAGRLEPIREAIPTRPTLARVALLLALAGLPALGSLAFFAFR